jgi:hypothetical protein
VGNRFIIIFYLRNSSVTREAQGKSFKTPVQVAAYFKKNGFMVFSSIIKQTVGSLFYILILLKIHYNKKKRRKVRIIYLALKYKDRGYPK